MSDTVGTPINCGSADNMFLNPTVDVLSTITHGGWNFRGENRILLYLNFYKHCLYARREFHGSRNVMEIIYPPRITDFVDNNNPQIETNFASVIFKTQVKALRHDGHLCPFKFFMIASLLQHKKYLKCIVGEASMIKFSLLQSADVFGISLDTLIEWGREVM